jgi:thiol:disulfide interchange protein
MMVRRDHLPAGSLMENHAMPRRHAALVLALLLAAPGCGRFRSQRGASTPDPSGLFASLDLPQALDRARSGGQIVMVDVYTDWCGWCKKLDRETYSDRRVREALREFVPIKVDAEKGGRSVAETYGIDGFPTILFVAPDGRVVRKVQGFVDAEEMLRILASMRKPT